jgi:hypothetical protein
MVVIIIGRKIRRLHPGRHAQSLLAAGDAVSAMDTCGCRKADVTAAFS